MNCPLVTLENGFRVKPMASKLDVLRTKPPRDFLIASNILYLIHLHFGLDLQKKIKVKIRLRNKN